MNIKHLREISTGSPSAGALNTGEVKKILDFLPITRYSGKRYKIAPQLLWNAITLIGIDSYAIYQMKIEPLSRISMSPSRDAHDVSCALLMR